jgi:hypothetical protein
MEGRNKGNHSWGRIMATDSSVAKALKALSVTDEMRQRWVNFN